MSADIELAESAVAADEALWERRMRFRTQRNAGHTFAAITDSYNAAQRKMHAEALDRGEDPGRLKQLSVTTVRKDVDHITRELVTESTREYLVGQQQSVILDVRRAFYNAMAGGDIDAGKMVLSTLQHERDLFGLDAPKRVSIGVGTDAEFAETLTTLIEAVAGPGSAPPELAHLVRQNRDDAIDAEVVELAPSTDVAIIDADDWSNVGD